MILYSIIKKQSEISEAAAFCTVAGERLDTRPRITEAAAAASRDTFPPSYINTSFSVGENWEGVWAWGREKILSRNINRVTNILIRACWQKQLIHLFYCFCSKQSSVRDSTTNNTILACSALYYTPCSFLPFALKRRVNSDQYERDDKWSQFLTS